MNVERNIDRQGIEDRMYARKLTNTELAKRLGVNKSAITRMFDGEREPSVYELETIASSLGTTVEEIIALFGGRTSRPKNERKKDGIDTAHPGSSAHAQIRFEQLCPVGLSQIGYLCVVELEDGKRELGVISAAFGSNEFEFAPMSGALARCRIAKAGRVLGVTL